MMKSMWKQLCTPESRWISTARKHVIWQCKPYVMLHIECKQIVSRCSASSERRLTLHENHLDPFNQSYSSIQQDHWLLSIHPSVLHGKNLNIRNYAQTFHKILSYLLTMHAWTVRALTWSRQWGSLYRHYTWPGAWQFQQQPVDAVQVTTPWTVAPVTTSPENCPPEFQVDLLPGKHRLHTQNRNNTDWETQRVLTVSTLCIFNILFVRIYYKWTGPALMMGLKECSPFHVSKTLQVFFHILFLRHWSKSRHGQTFISFQEVDLMSLFLTPSVFMKGDAIHTASRSVITTDLQLL